MSADTDRSVRAADQGADSADVLDRALAEEAAHLEASRAALRAMRARTAALADAGGDPFSSEALGRILARRMEQLLDDGTTPLFFGRLDFGPAGEFADESFHIGRRHVNDDAGDPMVVDWRAPVATAFYRATALDPSGVRLRRRFGFARGRLTSYEDERLDRHEELGTTSRILTEEIERPRIGPMRDIVATIQPDQDALVRADLETSVCVQGSPGTGKTAVGLHRAAYLLYTHRDRLRIGGVLVVGPNTAFLSYISQVLPALGEVDVEQRTIEQLTASVRVRAVDRPEAAAVKGDARMATVIAAALTAAITRPRETLLVTDGGTRLRLGPDELARLVDDVRRESLPYATARERVALRVAERFRRQLERRGESPPDRWVTRLARSRQVTSWLDRVWPPADPATLVAAVLGDREVLARAADGVLSVEEQTAIAWLRPPRSVRTAPWTAADAVLIDEVAGLLDRVPSYGHVIVDEAQDLTPMQARAIARRSRHGSLTVLGDLAQGTAVGGARDWPTQLAHLGKPAATVVPLTTGYRVPAEILALANRLLPVLESGVAPAVSIRRARGSLAVRDVASPAGTATSAVAGAVTEALAAEGSVAVIAADSDVPAVRAALDGARVATMVAGDGDESASRVTVVPASLAKGLEYDTVIVVEPAAIVAAEPRGLNRLYVVLTRAVSRLVVLHARPLPAVLQ